jgi:malate dehydrogenase (quinone)
MIQTQNPAALDVVLIGAGIMSATLGTVLKELEPSLSIMIFETLEGLEQCGYRPRGQLRA